MSVSLYRIFDADNNLLYVGVTSGGMSRQSKHWQTKEWWPQAKVTTWESYPTRADAEAAETAAILNERPRHNKTARQKGRPYVGKVREIRMPDDLWDQIVRECEQNTGESVSQWIRTACGMRLVRDDPWGREGADIGARYIDRPG